MPREDRNPPSLVFANIRKVLIIQAQGALFSPLAFVDLRQQSPQCVGKEVGKHGRQVDRCRGEKREAGQNAAGRPAKRCWSMVGACCW
jgi:hypothetical protein